MKKLVRNHRTIGVELARGDIQFEGHAIPTVVYQTEPEGIPEVMLGNSALLVVTEVEIEKYFVNKMSQVMAQALYFGLDSKAIRDITTQALERSERYAASIAPGAEMVG